MTSLIPLPNTTEFTLVLPSVPSYNFCSPFCFFSLKSPFTEHDAPPGSGESQARRPSARESSVSPIALTSPGRNADAPGASPPVNAASPVNPPSASPLSLPQMPGSGPGGAPKGLEMFLIQRAKALQQANPALKALVDLQGMIAVQVAQNMI